MKKYSEREIEVLKELVDSDEIISPRLRDDTLVEKVQIFRPRIIDAAQRNEVITYSELTGDFRDLAWQYIGEVLQVIGLIEYKMGRPLLPAIVVSDRNQTPGVDYFSLIGKLNDLSERNIELSNGCTHNSMWEKHKLDVWNYDWGNQNNRQL